MAVTEDVGSDTPTATTTLWPASRPAWCSVAATRAGPGGWDTAVRAMAWRSYCHVPSGDACKAGNEPMISAPSGAAATLATTAWRSGQGWLAPDDAPGGRGTRAAPMPERVQVAIPATLEVRRAGRAVGCSGPGYCVKQPRSDGVGRSLPVGALHACSSVRQAGASSPLVARGYCCQIAVSGWNAAQANQN